MRLFVALQLPELLLQKLAGLQDELRAELRSSNIRWTKPTQLHLTLRFLGRFPEAELEQLCAAIGAATGQARPMQLRVQSLGCFPDARRPRILWVGTGGDHDHLQHLQRTLLAQTQRWGEEDNRPFHPHLTLGRLKEIRSRQAEDLREAIRRRADLALGEWRAKSVELMRSELGTEGAQYHLVGSFPFGSD